MQPSPLPKTPSKKDVQQSIDALVSADAGFLRGPQINIISASDQQTSANSQLVQQYMSMLQHQNPLKPPNSDSASTKPGNYSSPVSLKTQKKKYLKLFTTISTHKSDNEDEDSNRPEYCNSIANEELSNFEREDMQFWEEKTVRAGMNYFEEECKRSQAQVEKRRILEEMCIEREERIVVDPVVQSELLWEEKQNSRVKSGKQRGKIGLSLSRRKGAEQKSLNPQINETFRYCIGCLKSVLEVNIPHHQQQCSKFQQVLSMNLKDFLAFLNELTKQVISQLEEQTSALTPAFLSSMIDHTNAFLQECELVSSTGQPSQIYNFKFKELASKNQPLLDFIGSINRLNWFLRIRQKLQQTYLQ